MGMRMYRCSARKIKRLRTASDALTILVLLNGLYSIVPTENPVFPADEHDRKRYDGQENNQPQHSWVFAAFVACVETLGNL